MKKNRSLLLTIVSILLIMGLLFNHFRVHMNYTYDISKEDNLVTINIKTFKGFKLYDADNVTVKIYNKYKKDVSIEKELSALSKGKYNLYYYPQWSGTYIMNINVKIDGKVIAKQKEFKI